MLLVLSHNEMVSSMRACRHDFKVHSTLLFTWLPVTSLDKRSNGYLEVSGGLFSQLSYSICLLVVFALQYMNDGLYCELQVQKNLPVTTKMGVPNWGASIMK